MARKMKRQSSNYHRGSKEDKCYFCESGPPLREHHIIPQRFDGPDTPQNIVELCDLCHKRIERLYDRSFYEWFGIPDEKGERMFHRPCERYECTNQAKVKIMTSTTVHTGFLGYRSGPVLCCRPCAAKYANVVYTAKLKEYRKWRSKLHGVARTARESSGYEYQIATNSKNMGERPDANEIYQEMILEEADE